MDKHSDLKRAFLQFKRHEELNYLSLKSIHKIVLSFVWLCLLPTVVLDIFYKKKKSIKDVFVLEYTNEEPYGTIYRRLKLDTNYRFVSLDKYYVPRIPWVLVKDIADIIRNKPLFFIKNIYFFGALALKISHYNSMIQRHNINYLIVFQEYSFYSSYLTRMIEYDNGKLYNIQHGIPGKTYSFFRFSKCFIWGEHYKNKYIENQADSSQFVISGSLFHDTISVDVEKYEENIDIVYIMQGYVGNKEDTLTILKLLEELSAQYTIRILQHPRHRVKVPYNLHEFEGKITEAILRSNVILSRYSTAMLDALYLGKTSISFIGSELSLRSYVDYLPKKLIIKTVYDLEKRLIEQLEASNVVIWDNKYIDKTKNPIKVIQNEIHQDIVI